MRLRLIAGVGVVILILSLTYLGLGMAARLLDGRIPSDVTSAPCLHPDISVTMPRRRISVNDSEVVTVVLSNTTTSTCVIEVSIRAPGFEIDPPAPMQSVTLAPNAPTAVQWVVSPLRMGTHRILVKAGLNYHVIGVVVTNVLGLTDRQATWLSYLGTFFGSSLTVPWLYEAWQRRKREADQENRIDKLEQEIANLRDAQTRDRRSTKRWWQFWRP